MKIKRGMGWICVLLLVVNLISNIQLKEVQATVEEINQKGNILLKLENPVQNHELTEDFFIKGYALSTSGISKVEVYLDGILKGTADYGIQRDDIGNKYDGSYANAYKSGYTYKFSGATNGSHNLTVKAIDNDGSEQSTSITIINNNQKKLVMGTGKLTRDQMLQDIYSRCNRLTKNEMAEFVDYTIQEANIEGVDYDVAYALMMLETNYLNFGGDVKPEQNNFGGLGATGNGVQGESFESVQIGIRAIIQHIKAYGSKENLVQALVDPRFKYVERGSAIYVEHLGIKENPLGKGWAAGQDYGKKIKNIISRVNSNSTVYNNSYIKTVNIDGNYLIGNKVSISCDSNDNNNTLFKIVVREKSTNSVVLTKDYNSERTSSFTPSKLGTYIVEVSVKHKLSSNSADDTWTKEINVDKVSSITNVNISEPLYKDIPITITANADPHDNTLYRIWIRENGDWRVISDYSTNNVVTYIPKSIGTYAVQVDVKSKYSNNNYDDVWSKLIEVKEPVDVKINNVNITGKNQVNSPINIEIDTNVMEDTLYRIWIRENGTWKVISDYSTNNVATYIPKTSGTYAVQVDVKNKYSNKNYDDVWSALVDVKEAETLKINSVNVTGKNQVNSPINIEVDTNIKEDTLYRIWIRENGDWKVISDYSTNNVATYTPKTSGTYAIQVDVKNKYSNKNYDDVWSALVEVKDIETLKINSVNVTGKNQVNSPINIEVDTNIKEDTLYKIWIRENGNWKVISDYSTNNVATYTPKTSGTYAIQVDVKNKYSNKNYDDVWSALVEVKEAESLKINKVNVSGEMVVDEPIKVEVDTNIKEDTLYRIWIRENGNWKVISDYSTNNVATYIPKTSGTYAVQVDVKNKYSNKNYDDVWSALMEVNNPKPSINNVEITGERKVGNNITIKVNATPANDLLYRIWVKEDNQWRIISDYSEKNTAEFIPTKLGIYPIQVDIKQKNSSNLYDSVYSELIDINIAASSKIESINVTGEMKAGTPINIEAKATPSNSTLYRIWIKENNTWKVISDFSEQNKVIYTPKSSGNYAIQVDVKNKYSEATVDDVTSKLITIGESDKKTIVIDAGHGGRDGGASAIHGGVTFREATIALQISVKLKHYLEVSGYNVYMTRTDDTYLELVDRAKFANKIMADLFISVHCNSFTSSDATGVEVLYTENSMDSSVREELISMGYDDPEKNKQNRINESKALAAVVSKNLADSIGLKNRGAKSQNVSVLRNTIMPAILVECGFITNAKDIILLSIDSNQDTIARAISNTIAKVL